MAQWHIGWGMPEKTHACSPNPLVYTGPSVCRHCGEKQPVSTPINARQRAKILYYAGYDQQQISDELGVKYPTIGTWKRRDKWESASLSERSEAAVHVRHILLVNKEDKTGKDFKEIDLLGREIERFARIRKYEQPGGHKGHLNPKMHDATKKASRSKQDKANLIDQDALALLQADLDQCLFKHQEDWRASTSLRTRFILKSRQIGATWYFARERLIRALETGNNQIFISASKAQAHIFRNYIIQWVEAICGIKLTGAHITVQRGLEDPDDPESEKLPPVTLYFLGTNFRTAQGYNGDVIVDEGFWIHGFSELYKVASAMASHKQFTKTIFSTPSILSHEAYPLWSGDQYNRKRKKSDQVRVDIGHDALKNGALGKDGIWRQIVTLADAIEKGFDLIDIDQIKTDYAPDEMFNLFGCQFLDDSESAFPFQMLRGCMVDSWEVWDKDFDYYLPRPFGDGECWLGYDPDSGGADGAVIAVLAIPDKAGGKFRVLEKKRLTGLDFQDQDLELQAMADRYNITEIGINTNGAGKAVWELTCKWFPTARKIDYDIAVKNAMVMKTQNVMRHGRLEFDAGDIEIMQSFIAIRPQSTRAGGRVTYVAHRGEGMVGHAEAAWAIMHALFFEPLDAATVGGKKSSMELFET